MKYKSYSSKEMQTRLLRALFDGMQQEVCTNMSADTHPVNVQRYIQTIPTEEPVCFIHSCRASEAHLSKLGQHFVSQYHVSTHTNGSPTHKLTHPPTLARPSMWESYQTKLH